MPVVTAPISVSQPTTERPLGLQRGCGHEPQGCCSVFHPTPSTLKDERKLEGSGVNRVPFAESPGRQSAGQCGDRLRLQPVDQR